MTRDEAIARLKVTPEYIPGECSRCGARTVAEAEERCRPYQLPCGDYECGTLDTAPETDGLLHVLNPAYAELDGYLWHWLAFDEGETKVEPTWDADDVKEKDNG